jgi:translation initiation factor IF-2
MDAMEKIRVYDLAREVGLTNKELLDLLEKEGLQVKSHSSSIEAEYADLIRDKVFSARRTRGAAAAPAPAAPVSAPVKPAGGTVDAPAPAPAAPAVRAAARPRPAPAAAPAAAVPAATTLPQEIHLKAPITVRDLADALGRKPNEVIGQLMAMNVFATISQVVEVEAVERVCKKYGVTFVRERRERSVKSAEGKGTGEGTGPGENEQRDPRPPVIAFLGHVDHGKTSLQDAIRKTNVAAGEVGGITQSIGASVVSWAGQTITMIDTPGHEAFTAMRARGASATDIVVLVVAGDDGIMQQTVEAINHAREAKAPIVVAVNKKDLPGFNLERVVLQLQQQGLNPETWGGEVGVVPVSARTGEGIGELLERILLEAEILELKGNPDLSVRGVVVEAQLERGMGPTANVLVRNGSLHLGDAIVCGRCYGRVKAMFDCQGRRVTVAGPSTPVKVLGLSGVPEAGDAIEFFANEKEAKVKAEERVAAGRVSLSVSRQTSAEDLFKRMESEAKRELKVILKTDVRGSTEAIVDSCRKIQSEKITLSVIHTGVGEVTENDVLLASTAGAMILGFHVRVMPAVSAVARREGVDIRLYGIIYELLDDLEKILLGRLEPDLKETRIGQATIIQIFKTVKTGKVCGCRVDEGVVRVGANAVVRRGSDVLYKGRIQSLRRFQDDVREVKSGLECGIRLDNFEDFEVDDQIDVSTVEKVAATL